MPKLRIKRRLPYIEFDAADNHGLLAMYELDEEPGTFVLKDNADPSNTLFLDNEALSNLIDAAHNLRHAYDERELAEDEA